MTFSSRAACIVAPALTGGDPRPDGWVAVTLLFVVIYASSWRIWRSLAAV